MLASKYLHEESEGLLELSGSCCDNLAATARAFSIAACISLLAIEINKYVRIRWKKDSKIKKMASG